MVRIDTTRQKLAEAYAGLGTYFGLAPEDPGDSATPADEAVGGGYARVATTWSAGAAGVQNGTACIINAAGGTYGYAILCADDSGPTMIDNAKIAGAMLPSDGQIVLTPTYTQS
jgi:hypothetical protein